MAPRTAMRKERKNDFSAVGKVGRFAFAVMTFIHRADLTVDEQELRSRKGASTQMA